AGCFGFSGDDVEKRCRVLSGGEKARLVMAKMLFDPPNFLVLDEPTNHLDIESREALEDALVEFEGSILLISHDRALLEAVGSRTVVCEGGELRSHTSGWAAYQRRREEDEEAVSAAAAAAKRSAKGGKRQSPRTVAQRAARKAGRLAEKIELAEAELRALEEELADPTVWATPAKSKRANERHEAARRKVSELYEQWEKAERTVSAAGDPA
ncbi:MAG: ATP-binding cassette domain-containing protein, partial [Thermoleophilia bacterium]